MSVGDAKMTDEQKRELIFLVKNCLSIWNNYVTDDEYRTKDWEHVTDTMGQIYPYCNFDTPTLKAQWKILRDGWRREKNRCQKDDIPLYAIKWKFFKHLSFLDEAHVFDKELVDRYLSTRTDEEALFIEKKLDQGMKCYEGLIPECHDPNETLRATIDAVEVKTEPREHMNPHEVVEEEYCEGESLGTSHSDNGDENHSRIPSITEMMGGQHPAATANVMECKKRKLNASLFLSTKRQKPEPSPPTSSHSMDKFDALGHMVTQTLRDLCRYDELRTEQSYSDIEFTLCTLRKEILQKLNQSKQTQ